MVDISKSPYSDRFDATQNRTHVLYNPDRGLQASELTEQQSILHHYLGQLGNSIMTDGDIQSGMDFLVNEDASTITVHSGQVYLAGKVRYFKEQTIHFTKTGVFNACVSLEQKIITSVEDSLLLDQTSGVANHFSPGADRLEETVVLGSDKDKGISIFEFRDNELYLKKSNNNELTKINNILAERTNDESGSYRVNGFDLYTEKSSSASKLNLVVDSGRAYVLGYQVDKPTATRIEIDKSLTTRTIGSEAFYYSSSTRRGKLGNAPVSAVDRVTAQVSVVKATVSRGATADSKDSLANSSIFKIDKVWTDSVTYKQGTDFQLSNGNSLDWSPAGAEPATGTSYYVSYTYNKALVKSTDYKITIEGKGDNRQWFIDFNGMSGVKPVADSMVTVDYTYFLARKDLVTLDKDGAITVKKGQAEALDMASAPNHIDPYTLNLGTVLVLPDSETTLCNKSNLNRLSMAELQGMKTRIDNLEYNDAVNALDNPAMAGVNPVVLRGVFSDGFISLDKFDESHPDATVAFSFEDAEITLPYASSTKTKPSLLPDGLSHVWGRLVTAPFTELKSISQPVATEAMNVNPYNVFNKRGMLKLTPSEDNWIEEGNITITQEKTSTQRVKQWWRHGGESWTNDEINSVANVQLDGDQQWGDLTADLRKKGLTGSTLTSGGSQTIENMIEFMRQTDVKFEATNLTPNTNNLELFFDGIKVPITPAVGFTKGAKTGTIMSNAKGEAKGTYTIPAGIRTGIREVSLRNVDNSCATTFIAQGTKKTTQDIIIRTRVTIDLYDPLAQSFQFQSNQVVSSFGLYFGSKSTTDNVAVQVRGISEGGQPNKTVYAETVLTPSQVKVSATGALETKVTFDDPLIVDAGKEYCVVILTDSGDYTMWIATRGQKDIVGGATMSSNPYVTGVLYSSSNASAWTIHQDSDLKFNVYTAKFNPTATLEFDTMKNVQADSIVLMATYLTPENTGCIWDMKLVQSNEPESTTVATKAWEPIGNYVGIEIGEVAREVKIRATFKANQNMSPLLSLNDIVFTAFLTALSGSYVSRTIDATEAPFNQIKLSYEAFTPANTTVKPRYSTDGGTVWNDFTVSATTAKKSNEMTQYTFDEKVSPASEFKSIKFRLDLTTQNSFQRPRIRRLMTNFQKV